MEDDSGKRFDASGSTRSGKIATGEIVMRLTTKSIAKRV
jgi:hypothetical protein